MLAYFQDVLLNLRGVKHTLALPSYKTSFLVLKDFLQTTAFLPSALFESV